MIAVPIPKRIVEIKPGPVLDGMQALSTVVLEMANGELMEVTLPTYLFQRVGHD